MTYGEIVKDVMDRLGLSSNDSAERITRTLQLRYKRVTSSIGLVTSRRTRVSEAATIGNRDMTFDGIEKIDAVIRVVGNKTYTLTELTNDEMLVAPVRDEPPQNFCVRTQTPTTVTVRLDCVPSTGFTLYAEGLASISRLAPDAEPAFAESFHDILIYGVMADEYRRKEMFDFMQDAEQNYESRLSDLKMFIAKSAYMENYQGKYRRSDGWWDTSGPRK